MPDFRSDMRLPDFRDPHPGRSGVFLFTTDHQERTLLFRSEADYTFGVNTLALGTLRHRIRVLCYVLMDNHLHLLLSGLYEDCLAYFRWVLHRLAMMMKARYGIRGILKADAADVQYVTDARMLLNEVAYLLRNPYRARVESPFAYPWAPFEVYFNPYLPLQRGEPVPGGRQLREILGTHEAVPADWQMWNGRILNRCFVDYQTVERDIGSGMKLFGRVRKFSLESEIAQMHGVEETLSFTDAEMQEKIQVICQHEYHVTSPQQLDRKALMLLARTLALRFGSPVKQISRLLGIDPTRLEQIL